MNTTNEGLDLVTLLQAAEEARSEFDRLDAEQRRTALAGTEDEWAAVTAKVDAARKTLCDSIEATRAKGVTVRNHALRQEVADRLSEVVSGIADAAAYTDIMYAFTYCVMDDVTMERIEKGYGAYPPPVYAGSGTEALAIYQSRMLAEGPAAYGVAPGQIINISAVPYGETSPEWRQTFHFPREQ